MEQTLTESYIIGRPTTGEQVGNYLLLHELGRGGYAQVYLAEHLYLKHLVALKLLNLSLNQHEDLVRFQYEARLLAQLQHRHIVRALNFDWEGDRPFLAMDYAPGGPIQQIFQQGTRLLPLFGAYRSLAFLCFESDPDKRWQRRRCRLRKGRS